MEKKSAEVGKVEEREAKKKTLKKGKKNRNIMKAGVVAILVNFGVSKRDHHYC